MTQADELLLLSKGFEEPVLKILRMTIKVFYKPIKNGNATRHAVRVNVGYQQGALNPVTRGYGTHASLHDAIGRAFENAILENRKSKVKADVLAEQCKTLVELQRAMQDDIDGVKLRIEEAACSEF